MRSGWFDAWLKGWAVVVLLLGSGCAQSLVSKMAFHPTRLQGEPAVARGIPQESVRHVELIAEDNVRLHAFHIPSSSRRALLFLHGNAGNASQRLPDALQLSRCCGTSVLLLSYRGYGWSEGHATEEGVYKDGRAALRWLVQQGYSEIFILGRSLGSAVAMDIAREHALAGVILVTPLSSGRDMASVMGFGWLGWCVGSPFDSVSKAPQVSCPALFIHGDRDRVIPLSLGQKLFQAMPTASKRFQIVPGADHNGLIDVAGADYWRWIAEFVSESSRAR